MRLACTWILAAALFIAGAGPGAGAEKPVFEFAEKPKVEKKDDTYEISFKVKKACDATVWVENSEGKIVRHLASGLLGPNVPEPFAKNALAQKLTWDGKDDFGKPVPTGCKVKVGLGLTPSYGGTMAFSPVQIRPWSVTCDDDGNAYVFQANNLGGDIEIRQFSRDGKFLRNVMPLPGGLESESVADAFIIVDHPTGPIYVPKASGKGNVRVWIRKALGATVSRQGVIAWMNDGYRVKKYLNMVNTDGTNYRVGSQVSPWQRGSGRGLLAFNNAGDRVYVSSVLNGGGIRGRGKPYHCVFRYGLDDPTPNVWRGERGNRGKTGDWGGKVSVFVGDVYRPGADNAHFNDPRGVAVDKDDNVYVADHGNARIQVFKPDGTRLRSVPCGGADRIEVHRKTGNVYVLTDTNPCLLLKLSPEGKELARFQFPGYRDGNHWFITTMALDDSTDPPIVWLTLPEGQWNKWRGLWRVADKGDKFEKLGDLIPPAKKTDWNPWADTTSEYLVVDPDDRYLYMKNSRLGGRHRNWGRFETTTGKLDETWWSVKGFGGGDELCFGPDGLLYGRTCNVRQGPEYVWRMDPIKGGQVPFPGCENGKIEFVGYHSPKFHRDGLCVGLNGDVYVVQHINVGKAKFEKEPWRAGKGFAPLLLNHYGPDGKLKRKDVIPGILGGPGGVRVDRAGSIFMPSNMKPVKRPPWDLLAGKKLEGVDYMALSPRALVKFRPEGGKIMIGQKGGGWTGVGARGNSVKVEGALASYCGLSPFGGGCVCPTCRADLDGFGRSFAPIYHLSLVMALDNNLNPVARIGTFGGPQLDSDGKVMHVPELGMARPAYTAVNDRALYVADKANRCVIRVTLGYQVVEDLQLE